MAHRRVGRSDASGGATGGEDVRATPTDSAAEISGLRERVGALRRSAELPGAKLRPTLEAVLAELDLTVGILGKLRSTGTAGDSDRTEGADAERRLLRAVFQDVPAPIFLLEKDGVVRRMNRHAAALLGTEPGSASGKPFAALVELADRATVKNQITSLVRTRRARRVRCKLRGASGPVETAVTIDLVRRPGESAPLIMAVLGPALAPLPAPAAGHAPRTSSEITAHRAIAAATQRFDLMSAATRLMLENAAFSESVMLRRCAALLASELNTWVLVDVEQEGELRRVFVAAPIGGQFADLAREIEDRNPGPGSLPWEVHKAGRSRLLAEASGRGVLGTGSSGIPVLQLLGATAVLCAPLSGGEQRYGTFTLARRPDVGPFTTADLQLVEEIAQQVAVAIKVGRMFLRRSAVTEALQASLLPRELPHVPGIDIATAYVPATEDLGVGGDFYDVYPSAGGWGMMIGDVCGRGEAAAAATAMARHSIRVFSHWNADPADTLRMANEVMHTSAGGEQFVTAVAARLEWHEGMLHVALASTGHPAPLLMRPDGRVRMLSGGGLPLGFFGDARPAAERLDLKPGDVLFFYTDGVTEARGADGTYFESKLANELIGLAGRSARDVVAAMRDCVLEFSESYLRDDISMVAMRVLDPPDEITDSRRGEALGNHHEQREVPSRRRQPDEATAWI